ncbi:MAG: IS630 family transposase [Chloroflexi bacterium]|nr:IS630 family transposase [Chloroflexota bacterium]
MIVEVKALACQLPAELGLPLARFSLAELRREAIGRGIVATVSGTTLWRWLSEDAIRPWRHRSWIFPRDPAFAAKAGDVLDLYAGRWRGRRLRPDEFVLCADEKTSIQARARIHPTSPPAPGRSARVEHEYERKGALAYLAAWDVHRARIVGRCEPSTGIEPFERLVGQVMDQEPYRSARRVFWVVDNGSSHRGEPCVRRLREQWPRIRVVHLPIHASWLNQVEIYFSVVQRKVLTPAAWRSTEELADQLRAFEDRYAAVARPFEWRFTRRDLQRVLAGLPHGALVA